MSPKDFAKTMTELGLSQVDAARLLSVDPRTVRRWVADPTEITGPAEQALLAWRRLNQLGLPWSPDSIDLVETDPDQISLHRADAVDLDNLLARVEARGGSSGAWIVDLNRNKATLGPIEVSFYIRQNGGFSPQAYTRRDDVPANLKRDWSLIEDAYACIAKKLRKKQNH